MKMVRNNNRIYGIDIARAFAVFIMVLVNFRVVLGLKHEQGLMVDFFTLLQGKGAALFVVLAGVGIAQMLKKERVQEAWVEVKVKQQVLYRRSVFLFVFGLIFYLLWPADILHFYGFYISIGAFFAGHISNRWLLVTAVFLIIVYPIILTQVDFDAGWDFSRFEYLDFWTSLGFVRNLFVNGFHPVIPWVSFVLAGIWLGRQEIRNRQVQLKILLFAALLFSLVLLVSQVLTPAGSGTMESIKNGIVPLWGMSPMPPFPMYLLGGIFWSYGIIMLFIILSEKYSNWLGIWYLVKTGQMAFTHYVAHVIFGIVIPIVIYGENQLSTVSIFWYAIVYMVITIWFSSWWAKKYGRGPMGLFMRFIAG